MQSTTFYIYANHSSECVAEIEVESREGAELVAGCYADHSGECVVESDVEPLEDAEFLASCYVAEHGLFRTPGWRGFYLVSQQEMEGSIPF